MTKITGSIDITPTNYSPDDVNDIDSHMDAIEAKLKAMHNRVGHIVAWPTEFIPDWGLPCDGQWLDRDDYSELYAVIGDIYSGTAPTSRPGDNLFRTPDYRGYFIRGMNDGSGQDPDAGSRTARGDGTSGDAVGTTQGYGHTSHTHTMARNTNQRTGGGGNRVPGSGSTVNTNVSGGSYDARPDTKTIIWLIIHGGGK